MTLLDRVLPAPRLMEVDSVTVGVPAARAWEAVRHADFGRRSRLVRALFLVRTLVNDDPLTLRIDDLRSSEDRPGFQILIEDAPREVVVGAIGKVWHLDIPFVHVPTADAFARYADEGVAKVAWAIRVRPLGERQARVDFEVRVDATDDESWHKFRTYFALIGVGSRFIRRTLLAGLVRELGAPDEDDEDHFLPGDEHLPDARAVLTHGITIDAPPGKIWPWLLQMGCDRAGFYSVDLLDNGGRRSARELHPELQNIRVGDMLPAHPGSDEGFEVLRIEPKRALVLGGLWDAVAERQLPFASPRPDRFWQVTWAFALEPLNTQSTRLRVRARAAFPSSGSFHAAWIRPVHAFMERSQLRGLKARVEGTLARDDLRDVLAGIGGAGSMVFALTTPFLRDARSHWGLDAAVAGRAYPGDVLVPSPSWSWTHAVEIDATAASVWPWLAQIGANKAGFYSYQWLENLSGCDLRNSETVHPEWAVEAGDGLVLHPKMPPLAVVAAERGSWFVAHAAPDEAARKEGRPWVEASWLFHLEPLGAGRTRLVSRYRANCSDDLRTRLAFGPALVEPIGFAMDRRMLLTLKELAERSATRGRTR